ncbi:MAG: hypothetical protein V1897_12010 [Pseudomonadota bacterium]
MTPSEALEEIKRRFNELGIDKSQFNIELGGDCYRMTLDSECFVVYRINRCKGHNHHVPGWPVCLVTRETIFEESSNLESKTDHCACEITIDQWLGIVEKGRKD